MKELLQMNNLAFGLYNDMEMTNKRQILSFNTRKASSNEASAYSGDLLYCWPYFWIENMEKWESFCQQMAKEVTKRFQRRIRNFDANVISSDLVYFPFYAAPLAWREEASSDVLSEGYPKLVIWLTWSTALFFIDDTAEDWRQDIEHADRIRSLAKLLYEIAIVNFRSIEEVRENLDFKFCVKGNPFLEGNIFVVFDLFNDIKSFLKVKPVLMNPSRTMFSEPAGRKLTVIPNRDQNHTEEVNLEDTRPSPFLYLARAVRNLFQLQTWEGCEGYSQILKKDLRQELRSWVVGYDLGHELFILMDGLEVPENVRSNFYWNNIHRHTRKLSYMTNDIFSLQKEILEVEKSGVRLDNGVLISMESDSLNLNEALEKYIESHNELLEIYWRECKFALENESSKFELSQEEKIVFDLSLKALPIQLAAIIQCQLRMPRYKNENVQVVFTDLDPFTF